MSEPSSAAAAALASGASVAFVATIGVDPQSLFWGAVGSSIGVASTDSMGRLRALFVFIGSVLACALIARWTAHAYFDGHDMARNGVALALGMFFPAIKQHITQSIPEVWAVLMRKIGAKS
jgi:hypothetical protein